MTKPDDAPTRSHGRLSIRASLQPRDLMTPTPQIKGAWTARVITLMPGAYPGVLGESVTGKALKDGLWALDPIDLRMFGEGKHRAVDDTPAGGGAGMVLRPDIMGKAITFAQRGVPQDRARWPVIYLSPRGKRFDQAMARRLAAADGVTLICGRFEGLDERVIEHFGIEEVSLGDFVLTGGDLVAQAMLDATVRLHPGVLGNDSSAEEESFSNGLLEHPQYTRPATWQGRAIPEVLTSGHHGKVAQWRTTQARQLTAARRPDLWAAVRPDLPTRADPELFGSEAQQTLLRRGAATFDLLRDDPQVTYYGRAVGLLRFDERGQRLLPRLATLQGATNILDLPPPDLADTRAALEGRGLVPTTYDRWSGTTTALTAARQILDTTPLPEDIEVKLILPKSRRSDVAKLANLALSAGVLPLAGRALRGLDQPGLGAVALDAGGQAVSCAASVMMAHPAAPGFGRLAWWGMLATDPARRGERLALILGARVMVEMSDRFGIDWFFTGVEPGNTPSEAVCARCGLAREENLILSIADPTALPGGRMTK